MQPERPERGREVPEILLCSDPGVWSKVLHDRPDGKPVFIEARLNFISIGGGIMASYDKELDARGLNCPLPILRAKKVLNDLIAGQVLRVVATDPGSVKDFQAFAKQTGNELLESNEASGEYTFLIRKKA
jgi:tRNA 2-thiouridine synthesizing protein A